MQNLLLNSILQDDDALCSILVCILSIPIEFPISVSFDAAVFVYNSPNSLDVANDSLLLIFSVTPYTSRCLYIEPLNRPNQSPRIALHRKTTPLPAQQSL